MTQILIKLNFEMLEILNSDRKSFKSRTCFDRNKKVLKLKTSLKQMSAEVQIHVKTKTFFLDVANAICN